jgi:hypothetical protein
VTRDLKIGLFALAANLALFSPALAGGAFDFRDPCINAPAEISDQRDADRLRVRQATEGIPALTACPKTWGPVAWIDENFKAAKNECSPWTQVIRAATGISAKDVAKNGPLGGENSELRKFANTIAGGTNSEVRKALRFLDPGNTSGIFGGQNSFFRKPFG